MCEDLHCPGRKTLPIPGKREGFKSTGLTSRQQEKKKKKKVRVDNKLPHFTLKRQVMPRKTKGDKTKGSGIQRRDHCTKSHKQTPAQSKRAALIAPSSSMPRLFFIYLTQAPMKCEGMNHVPLFHLHTARKKKNQHPLSTLM